MKRLNSRSVWGALLILVGFLLLLESLKLITIGGLWAILFALPGALFVYTFFTQREAWWAIIPGLSLLGISGLIGLDLVFPESGGNWGASLFLGGIGLSFVAVYARTRQWWAIIPGGVMLSLAVSLGLETLLSEDAFAGLFMLGIGGTFGLLYLMPTPEGETGWAIYPAGILGLIGLLLLSAAINLIGYLWPIALIAVGIIIILRATRRA